MTSREQLVKPVVTTVRSNGLVQPRVASEEALAVLNNDIQNEMTVWIDSRPFSGEVLSADDLQKCRKEVSVTNRLVGG